MIKAVIFDMDGVLIDTEKHFLTTWQQAAHDLGVMEFGPEHALMLRSFASKFAEPATKEIFGEDFPYTEIRMRRRVLMEEVLKKYGIEKKPGVEEALKALREKGYKLAVATASDYERASRYLKQVDLFDCFDEILCATMVENGKPYPDVYLYACEELGEDPKDCIAVEDSPNGVTSAYRAGMKVIMIPDLTQPDEELEKMLYKKVSCAMDLTTIL